MEKLNRVFLAGFFAVGLLVAVQFNPFGLDLSTWYEPDGDGDGDGDDNGNGDGDDNGDPNNATSPPPDLYNWTIDTDYYDPRDDIFDLDGFGNLTNCSMADIEHWNSTDKGDRFEVLLDTYGELSNDTLNGSSGLGLLNYVLLVPKNFTTQNTTVSLAIFLPDEFWPGGWVNFSACWYINAENLSSFAWQDSVFGGGDMLPNATYYNIINETTNVINHTIPDPYYNVSEIAYVGIISQLMVMESEEDFPYVDLFPQPCHQYENLWWFYWALGTANNDTDVIGILEDFAEDYCGLEIDDILQEEYTIPGFPVEAITMSAIFPVMVLIKKKRKKIPN